MTEKNTSRLSRWNWTGLLVIGALDVLGLIIISATGHLPGREFAGIGISAYGAMSVLLAMIFLKEKVSGGQWLGLAMIVAAVATISLSQPRCEDRPPLQPLHSSRRTGFGVSASSWAVAQAGKPARRIRSVITFEARAASRGSARSARC